MKNTFAFGLGLFFVIAHSVCLADGEDLSSSSYFSVDAGSGASGLGQTPMAVAFVKFDFKPLGVEGKSDKAGDRFSPTLYAKLFFNVSGKGEVVPEVLVDAVLNTVDFEYGNQALNKTVGGLTRIDLNYHRDVAVGLDSSVSFSILGFWMNSQIAINEDCKAFFSGVLNLLPIGYTAQHFFGDRREAFLGKQTVVESIGLSPNTHVEAGFEFLKRFKITFAEHASFSADLSSGGDGRGFSKMVTGYSNTTLSAEVEFVKGWSAFVRGGYAASVLSAPEGVINHDSERSYPLSERTGSGQALIGVSAEW